MIEARSTMEHTSPSSVAAAIAELPPGRTAMALPFAGTSWGKARSGGRPALSRSPFGRSASMPEHHHGPSNKGDDDDDDDGAPNSPGRSADDIDSHRRHETTADVSTSDMNMSDSARRMLERMRKDQLQNFRLGLLEERHSRRKSSGSIGVGLQNERLSRIIETDEEKRRSSGGSNLASLMLARIPSFNGELKDLKKTPACILEFDSNFNFKHDDYDMNKVHKHSDSHSVDPRIMPGNKKTDFAIPNLKGGRRRATAAEAPSRALPCRRDALLSRRCSVAKEQGHWRPLSSDDSSKRYRDREPKEEDKKKRKKTNNRQPEQGGIGGLWNKLASSLTLESGPIIKSEISASKIPAMHKKEVDGATYFRRGKCKMAKDKYLQAVALFNLALVRQREELGENHIDCGTTLNEIGVCWLVMGERYPALTALKEALYIRQKRLGDGAMEVAETTNNIWMIYHEEMCEMEDGMAEEKGGGVEDGCDS